MLIVIDFYCNISKLQTLTTAISRSLWWTAIKIFFVFSLVIIIAVASLSFHCLLSDDSYPSVEIVKWRQIHTTREYIHSHGWLTDSLTNNLFLDHWKFFLHMSITLSITNHASLLHYWPRLHISYDHFLDYIETLFRFNVQRAHRCFEWYVEYLYDLYQRLGAAHLKPSAADVPLT